jgi:capsular exopolysaccharide synthesis family protein
MAEYAALEAEVKQAERYSELLDGRINELMTLQQVPAMNIRVLEPAQASLSPVRPAPVKVLAGALLIGLFCGSGLALGRARMEQRLVSLPEIVSLVNAPVLGAIPYISRSLRDEGAITRSGVQRNPLSEVAEAHRMIRASICYGLPPSRSRTILVTSAASKEGKSTVSSGLAWALCEAGERVLLIDADLRRPVQHSIFNLDGTRGVTDVVAGRLSLNEAIASSGISGLDVLPCGSAASVPTGIINSEAFADLLADVSHRYDRIVLDSPPAALVADARVLAALTDVTLLVVRMGKTTRRDALRAVHGLVNVGARVGGVIVNVARSPFSDFYPGGDIYYRHNDDHHSNGNGNGNGKVTRLANAPGARAGNGNGNGHGSGSGYAASAAAPGVSAEAPALRPPVVG